MLGIPTHDLAQHAESDFEPSTMPGGIPSHFHVERFGNTSHIAPSILVVEITSHVHPRHGASSPIRIPEPRRVTIGNTTYITSHVPSSSIPSSSNAIPPPHSRDPLGQNVTTSHVHYGMPDIHAHDLAHHAKSEVEPSTMPGGIPIPFHAKRFGSTSHIVPSIPMVEATSHVRPRASVSNHMRILESK